MDLKDFEFLLEKYKAGPCTDFERQQLYAWLNSHAQQAEDPVVAPAELAEIEQRLAGSLARERRKSRKVPVWFRGAAAAAVLLMVLGAGYLFWGRQGNEKEAPVYITLADAAPGGNKAVLILADGRKVELDAASGQEVDQAHSKITIKDGEVIYSPGQNTPEPDIINTIVTPKGGQFQLTLSDGTKVWLNAASSLSFAPTFSGRGSRVVQLSGEACFNVAHDARRPFIVETPKQKIKVLGTRFNVHAYPEENAVTTSLLEGKVEISTSLDAGKILYPGQAAVTERNTTRLTAMNDYAAAWTSGQIRFEDTDLPTILRTVSRWYDVAIIYERTPSTERFTGGVLRKSSLAAFLSVLDSWNIKHELREGPEGKELVIK